MSRLFHLAKSVARRTLSPDLRFKVRFGLYAMPVAYEVLTWLDGSPAEKVVNGGTDLVVDGFPRSGQSYVVAVLQYSNPGRQLCTHAHSPRILEKGAKAGVPTVCLIRPPREAVASLCQFLPSLRLSTALDYYLTYYRRALSLRDDLMLISFSIAVADPNILISRVNARWGSGLVGYTNSDADRKAVRALVEESAKANYSKSEFQNVVALPTESRRSADEFWGEAGRDDYERLREAELLHRSLDGDAQNGWPI